MKIFGIGTDIVNINRVKKSLKRGGNNFKNKIFSKNEILYCEKKINPSSFYAKRFAAKEAFVKALGTGFRNNINYTDIEVINNLYGKPFLIINKKVISKMKTVFKIKKFNIFLSISDEKKYSIASVLISKK